jgi:hypothetical protein
MTLEQFRQKAQRLRATARGMAIATDVMFAAGIVLMGLEYTKISNPISRAGLALLAAGMSYAIWQAHKQLWPAPLDPNASIGLEAYRRELERARDYARFVWKRTAPIMPGAIVFALPGIAPLLRMIARDPKMVLTNSMPFCIMLAIWFVLVLPARRRRLRKIQRELDTLDGLAERS